jgi:hypothetical protein
VARQHDVGSLVQKGPHPPVTAFRCAAGVVDLARLIPSDTLGGLPSSGLGKVTSDLLGDFQPNAAGVWGFALLFTLNVTLPGSASQTVLFMTDEAFSMATGTPEPSTWTMMLLGFASLGVAGYRRARAA